MIQKEIELKINTGGSEAELKKVNKGLEDISDTSKGISKDFKKSAKESKKLATGVKGVAGMAKKAKAGFQAMGMALKAAGVGLIVAAFATLKEILESNQKVVDTFSASFEFLAIVFNEVSTALQTVNKSISESTENFNALWKVLDGMLTITLTPIKLAFHGIKTAIIGAQLAWESSWMGGNDPEKIKELKANLEESAESMVQVGKDVAGAYSNIVTNAVEAASEVGEIGSQVVEEISKINLKVAAEQAQANVKLKNAAELAQAQQQGLIELYDRQAEKLRQLRDNEFKSIDERIKANDDLKAVLDEQEEAMLKLADLQVAQASRQYNLNKNLENEKALIEAKNERLAVLAQIEGFRSEQDSNANALLKEKLELTQSLIDAESERTIAEAQATAELEENEIKKINILLEALEQERQIEEERLKLKRDSYAEGTQAFVDAQIELDNFISDANIRKVQLNHDLNAAIKAQEDEALKNRDENRDKDLAREKELQDKKFQMQNDALAAISELVIAFANESEESQKKAFQLNKAISLAQAIVSTAQGIISQLAVPQDALTGANFIKAGIVAATGAAQVATILKTQFEGGGASAPSSPSAPSGIESQAPAFNIVGQSGFNQIAQALGQQPPVQAYVVSGNVTTAQALDNNIIETATF